ncbi:hypothetical protein [Reyranella sp.]|jgi:hypothetical protein|uniref:hypothetical protein n=1 Tax=Reyranella sp. TaxID=1929291 RepID=UPI002F92937C
MCASLSDEPLTLQLLQGSFEGDSDGLFDLRHSNQKTITVQAKGFRKIDHFDDDGLLYLTTYYNIKVGDAVYLGQISGRSLSRDGWVDIPVLNVNGYLGTFGKVGRP